MNFDYKKYWQDRYKNKWNSGAGSYGANAQFKADFINKYVEEHKIFNVLEVWCGDWNNLWLYKIENYVWWDVSQKAIDICKKKYNHDDSKWFVLMDEKSMKNPEEIWVDLVICLDVLFHVFPKKEWEKTINFCFNAGKRVLLYTFLYPTGHAEHINDYRITPYLDTKGIKYKIYKDVPPNSQSRFIELFK